METKAFSIPFRYWLIEDFVPRVVAEEAYREAIVHVDPWVRYDNDCERGKRTTRDVAALGEAWQTIFGKLLSDEFVGWLAALSGVKGLQADATLYGSGCHVTDPGGWLQPHLDFALSPSGLERRINVVVFLNPEWRTDWGGALELLDDAGAKVMASIYPAAGRACVWEAGDLAFHGTEPTTVAARPRVTAASYYLAPVREGVTRRRALFVPRR